MTQLPSNEKNIRKEDIRCPFCQRRFETPDELTLHIVTRHTQSGISTRGPAAAGGSK
jgi:hypothetical protein